MAAYTAQFEELSADLKESTDHIKLATNIAELFGSRLELAIMHRGLMLVHIEKVVAEDHS